MKNYGRLLSTFFPLIQTNFSSAWLFYKHKGKTSWWSGIDFNSDTKLSRNIIFVLLELRRRLAILENSYRFV